MRILAGWPRRGRASSSADIEVREFRGSVPRDGVAYRIMIWSLQTDVA